MGLKNPVGNPQEPKERVHMEPKAYTIMTAHNFNNSAV